MIIHALIPYEVLVQRLDEVITKRINPEIYFSGATLDRHPDEEVRRVTAVLRKGGIMYSFHAPYMDLAPGGIDNKIRNATQERLEEILHLAVLGEAERLVCHPGYDEWRYGESKDLWVRRSVQMWRPLVQKAGKRGVTLILENVFEHGPETIAKLLKEIDSRYFAFCFDTGHWHIFARTAVEEWIKVLGSKMTEVHLHDNHGKTDEHLPPGDGTFDFPRFFGLLRTHHLFPILTLEVRNEDALRIAFERLMPFLQS